MAELVPAILTNDINDFRKKYADLFAFSHYFKKLHIDFTDGDFVPEKSIHISELGFLKSPFTLMAHLMVVNPKDYFEDAKKSGFGWVLFHYEVFDEDNEIDATIEKARDLGLKVGLVLNPETPLFAPSKFFGKVDLIQLMGIIPGAQGRAFQEQTYDRIKELKKLTKRAIISVDGGVKVGIARQCAKAGAHLLIAGSAILRSEDEEMAIEALKADIEM